MKKILLSFVLTISFSLGSNAQVTLTGGPLTYTGWQFGQLYTDGELQGTLTSVSLVATLTASTNYTFASDLTVYITPTSALATGGLLQVGGYTDIGADEYYEWTSGQSSTSGTVLNQSYTLTTPLNLTTNPTYNVWIGNGYDGEGLSTSGTWNNITLTLTGVSETTASANEFVTSKFNVYPNPAEDFVTISNDGTYEIRKIGITDINGRAIRTVVPGIASAETQLNVSDLTAGIYFLVIDTTEGNAVKKIMKK